MQATDLDGRAALILLKLAGINTSRVRYLPHEARLDDYVHLDMGEQEGVVIGKDGRTAFVDHHHKISKRGSSTTEKLYKALVAAKALPAGEPTLKMLVKFVTQEDNRSIPNEKKYFKESYRTIAGLSSHISMNKLLEYFSKNESATKTLNAKELRQLGGEDLVSISGKNKKLIPQAEKKFEQFADQGFVINSKIYGRVVVDINGQLPFGFKAAKGFGAGAYINWNLRNKGLFVSSAGKALPEKLSSQGKGVRETMWIKKISDKRALEKTNLAGILKKLVGSGFKPSGRLKDYLEG